ncbi:hypothetical protein IE81DRAFT_321123 [Ceraceosorus guamensis]|uniref:Uncharacterized protein n=1 Tax=Ceraceosorus guamensis TaxID=1522189 RepID=A0A316W5Y6_9BASI|nr:hypothetical protein IE81DRAFT_321123 [Ceraceosorus guamensis]PWN44508.1 hypothetical protein IE81DRAFT_321123 [Ceraceosorus guamensis]
MPKHAQPRRSVAVRAPKPLPPAAVAKAGEGSNVVGASVGPLGIGSSISTVEDSSSSLMDGAEAAPSTEKKPFAQPLPPKGVRAIHRPPHDPKVASAAEWNSLLCWARRQRGPQWDESTGFWQVDKNSAAYYAFSARPAINTALDKTNKVSNCDIASEDVQAMQGVIGAGGSNDNLASKGEEHEGGMGSANHQTSFDDGSPPPVGPGRAGRRR